MRVLGFQIWRAEKDTESKARKLCTSECIPVELNFILALQRFGVQSWDVPACL